MLSLGEDEIILKQLDSTSRYSIVAQNLRLKAELSRSLQVLTTADIPVIILKGAALKQTVYNASDIRPISDIDLLIKLDDWDDACQALKQADYLPFVEPPAFLSPFNSNYVGEMTFRGRNGISIDLHWELVSVEWLRRIVQLDLDYVWRTACPLPAPYDSGYQLEPVTLLLHLCVHLVQHGFAHTVGFTDIVAVLQYYQNFPWDGFLKISRLWGANTACFTVLEAVASQNPELVPTTVLDSLRPSYWRQKIVASVMDPKAGMVGKLKSNKQRAYFLHVLMADSPVRFASFLSWLFFPGLSWLTERYRLTNRISSYFAVVWHLFFVLYQGLLSVLAILPRFSNQKDGG